MRFTVTPLGATGGKSPDAIAKRIVDYLRPAETPTRELASGPPEDPDDGASRYYADGGDEPGRWLGHGASEATLVGKVNPDDFARVLAGRDPHTGVRLLTAQGSAGRRPALAVGTATRWGTDGEAVYDARDAAASLGLTKAEGEALLTAGMRAAMLRLPGLLAGTEPGAAFEEPAGAYLIPVIDENGDWWVTESELSRCEDARREGSAPERVLATGDPEDDLPLAEAARLAGVTARYFRHLCAHYEEHRNEIDAVAALGDAVGRAYLVAAKDTQGHWRVRRRDLAEFLERRHVPAVRVGYDLTLTTEKSVGILALLGDDTTRRRVLEAIEAGNDLGLAYLETHAATARAGGKPVGTRGWTAASFRHLTSRALDPFPHHHNVIANSTVDEQGERRALDGRGLYWHAAEASALATAEMRWRLTRDLGVVWRPARHGGWEIDGIDDELIREFSQRRSDIEDAVAELEAAIGRGTTIGELQTIVTDTRPAKRDVDAEELTRSWWRRALPLGLTPKKLRDLTRRVELPPPGELDRESVFTRLAAPDGLCATSSVFTRADVLHGLTNLPTDPDAEKPQPLLMPAHNLEALADDFLASEHAIELLPSSGRDANVLPQWRRLGVFTTPEILEVQHHILDWHRDGQHADLALVPTDQLDTALERHPRLTGEQRDLVTAFCTSGHQIQCGIGRAGAGKTTAMRAAVDAWQTAGYRILGAAVKGEAARILGAATGIPSETLAWYLVQDDPENSPLDARTVLIVDEASTVADRDLHKLLHLTRATGATVRLLGDPDQHGAVGAGGMFRVLCEHHPGHTPELSRSQRVLDPDDAAAAEALRDGRIDEALAHLAAADHLHVVDRDTDLYVDLLARWWEARQAGVEHPMVDRRNRTRQQLNRLAHRLLQTAGEIDHREIEASGERAFSPGDRVVARRTDRSLNVADNPSAYVRNGAIGTITRLHRARRKQRERIIVAFEGIGEITLPRRFFDDHPQPSGRTDVGLDHAYALTSYAVQGATFELSASRIDEHTSRAEAYVDITRGRHENHLYLTRGLDPLDGERLPRLPQPPVQDTVTNRLQASGPERVAIEIDPSAPTTPDAKHEDHELARERRRRERRIARLAPHHASQALVRRLPRRPALPYLQRRWRDTLAAILTHRDRWQPRPEPDSPFGWALGPPTNDPTQQAERQDVIERIIDLLERSVDEALRTQGLDPLPDWARPHLERLAAAGMCRPDPHDLHNLYRRIHDYRTLARTADNELPDPSSLLGPTPDDPRLAAIHRGLALELQQLEATPEFRTLERI